MQALPLWSTVKKLSSIRRGNYLIVGTFAGSILFLVIIRAVNAKQCDSLFNTLLISRSKILIRKINEGLPRNRAVSSVIIIRVKTARDGSTFSITEISSSLFCQVSRHNDDVIAARDHRRRHREPYYIRYTYKDILRMETVDSVSNSNIFGMHKKFFPSRLSIARFSIRQKNYISQTKKKIYKGCSKINARFEFAAICAIKCWQPKKKTI